MTNTQRSTTYEHPDIEPLNGRYEDEAPAVVPTKTEIAGGALVDYLARFRDPDIIAKVSERVPELEPVMPAIRHLADNLEDAIARAQASVMPVPRLLEVTGNIAESELAARFMETKMQAALAHAQRMGAKRHEYEHIAECFRVCATDFRAGLHLPETVIEGKVIPYNEDNDTGLRHASALRAFFTDVHARNVKAGWWSDLETGQPKKRSVGELFMLFVTEIAEAYQSWQDMSPDDKLPQFPGVGVEMGDLLIRAADFCGALAAGRIVENSSVPNPGDALFREVLQIAARYEAIRKTPEAIGQPEAGDFIPAMDVADMVDAKLDFNAKRPDHKIENRLKADGKKT